MYVWPEFAPRVVNLNKSLYDLRNKSTFVKPWAPRSIEFAEFDKIQQSHWWKMQQYIDKKQYAVIQTIIDVKDTLFKGAELPDPDSIEAQQKER